MGVIYRLTFPDGMKYIGKSVEVGRRMREHSRASRPGRKAKEWIERYGWDRVKQEVVTTAPNEQLNDEERRVIRDEKTLWPCGLNLTPGGDGGAGWGVDADRDAKLRAKWKEEAKPESMAKARARLKKLAKLPVVEYHAEMARLRRRAEKRGMPPNKLERLYPNVFTLEEIRRMQGKRCGIPGPKATGRLSAEQLKANKKERKRLWDKKQLTSSKFRPSGASPRSPRSAQGRYMGRDGEMHDAGSTCPSECDE